MNPLDTSVVQAAKQPDLALAYINKLTAQLIDIRILLTTGRWEDVAKQLELIKVAAAKAGYPEASHAAEQLQQALDNRQFAVVNEVLNSLESFAIKLHYQLTRNSRQVAC